LVQENYQEQSRVEEVKTPPKTPPVVVNEKEEKEAAASANRRLNEDLLEKARRLGEDIQALIDEYNAASGGTR
jgi:hypothetical protein